MSMSFLDDTDDWAEYEIVRGEILRLDREHRELRQKLEEAESALESDSAHEVLKGRIDELKTKLREIEGKLDGSLSMYR